MFWLSIIKTEKWDDVFQERAGLDQPPKRQAGRAEVNAQVKLSGKRTGERTAF